MDQKIENATKSPLVLVAENPHKAKHKLRIAWHLEKQARDFVWSQRSFLSPSYFFLACGLKKEPDGTVKEVTRTACHFEKGLTFLSLPTEGSHIIRAFIVWPKGKEIGWREERNFIKRLITLDSFTKHYKCAILNYSGEIDNFHRLASGPDNTGHTFHRMRESVMGPDYYLYDLDASIEVNVTR